MWAVFSKSQNVCPCLCLFMHLFVANVGKASCTWGLRNYVYILYTPRSHVTYLLLPPAVETWLGCPYARHRGAVCSALESEELNICTGWFLEFELDEGTVILRCELVSHLPLFFFFFLWRQPLFQNMNLHLFWINVSFWINMLFPSESNLFFGKYNVKKIFFFLSAFNKDSKQYLK